jgi:alpha-beta hydrolase superfamily lysophospholipase
MTYGFDTKLHGSSSTQGLSSLANELRWNLEGLHEDFEGGKTIDDGATSSDEEEKDPIPLIFIAHSLGGLIVREVRL